MLVPGKYAGQWQKTAAGEASGINPYILAVLLGGGLGAGGGYLFGGEEDEETGKRKGRGRAALLGGLAGAGLGAGGLAGFDWLRQLAATREAAAAEAQRQQAEAAKAVLRQLWGGIKPSVDAVHRVSEDTARRWREAAQKDPPPAASNWPWGVLYRPPKPEPKKPIPPTATGYNKPSTIISNDMRRGYTAPKGPPPPPSLLDALWKGLGTRNPVVTTARQAGGEVLRKLREWQDRPYALARQQAAEAAGRDILSEFRRMTTPPRPGADSKLLEALNLPRGVREVPLEDWTKGLPDTTRRILSAFGSIASDAQKNEIKARLQAQRPSPPPLLGVPAQHDYDAEDDAYYGTLRLQGARLPPGYHGISIKSELPEFKVKGVE